ncbi:MAG TPA: hypothetical protein VJS44_03200 [Pyrinomonadaceae bacterium]|nr:hypothetical protein [Pyrinomonadaceae bacterium]
MSVKVTIALAVLAGGVLIITWAKVPKQSPQITVKGIDELNLSLDAPYSLNSPGDVLIGNNGNHSPLAFRVLWRGIKNNGEVVDREAIRFHPLVLIEEEANKRAELLASEPMLPPRTKWLIGLDRESQQITGSTPSLEDIGGRSPRVFPDLTDYKQINITLDAVILENGQVVGSDPVAFGKKVQSLVEDYKKSLKK